MSRASLAAWLRRPRGRPLAAVFAVAALSAVGSLALVLTGRSENVLACVVYALAALSLGFSVYALVRLAPGLRAGFVRRAARHPFADSLLHDYGYRTFVFSSASFAVNVGYAVFMGVLGILSRSVWYGALAGYYLVLSLLRGLVILRGRRSGENGAEPARERTTFRLCGALLVVLSVALSGAVAQMAGARQSFAYAGLTIYASAAYAFYKLILSSVNLVRARRRGSPTVQSLRNIGLADAMVSILALQTAMFQAFSPEAEVGLLNALTGGAVCLLTAGLGVWMLVSRKRIPEEERKNGKE